jgi:hypothetical protein
MEIKIEIVYFNLSAYSSGQLISNLHSLYSLIPKDGQDELKLTWLGHGAFVLDDDGTQILVDPFIRDNPAVARTRSIKPDFIPSHGTTTTGRYSGYRQEDWRSCHYSEICAG